MTDATPKTTEAETRPVQPIVSADHVLSMARRCGMIGDDWYEIRYGLYGHSKRLTATARSVLDFARCLGAYL